MMRKGKLGKVECGECGNFAYKTEAQLRDRGPDYCAGCTDSHGHPVRMRCPAPEWHVLTPEGQAEALAEALAADGRKLEREYTRARVEAYPQLRCTSCSLMLTKGRSAELIDVWQRQNGRGWDHGDELTLTVSDYGFGAEAAVYPCCDRCGGDRFVKVKRGGKRAPKVEVPF